MTGVQALRGEPRRSDIVAVDLLVRSLSTKVADLAKELQGLKDDLLVLKGVKKAKVPRSQ